MPTLGAQQRAHTTGCSYDHEIPRPADKPCTAARHSTATAFQLDGCTCPDARVAYNHRASVTKKERQLGRPRLIDATGTHRRLRALMAIGWRSRDLAPRLGWWSGELDTLFRRATVHRRTADAVTRIYDDLANTPGPSEQTRQRALRAGYPPPLWWDDDTIDDPHVRAEEFLRSRNIQFVETDDDVDQVKVERYLDGDITVTLTRTEKHAALIQLICEGASPSAAGARVGVNGTYARRYAAEAGIDVGARRDHGHTDHLEETG